MKIKKSDNIIVLTGKDRGTKAKVIKVYPKKGLVLVEGVNMKKKHQRAKKGGQKGQIIDIAMPIHISNISLLSGSTKTRVGFKVMGDKKVRISKKTGKEI